MPITFNGKYLLLAAALFSIEICIALFVNDRVVRPFVGDVLVISLIYSFWRAFLNVDYRKLAFGVFLFACTIEILQFFDYVALMGLANNRIISIILGRTFEWMDFVAYLAGFLLILAAEKFIINRKV